MATYWAELDENNVVVQVITGVDDETIDGVPVDEWYTNFVGARCVQTWINRPDKIYAGIGYTYDDETQDFTPPYVEPVEPIDNNEE
jgi:hypothetical protein